MKYKNILSAIHNFGASFTSLMNYVDGGYVINDLGDIHHRGIDIEIDWLCGTFSPDSLATDRIKVSIAHFSSHLEKHLASQNVDLQAITEIKFRWPSGGRKFMIAIDDRGKCTKIYVNETK